MIKVDYFFKENQRRDETILRGKGDRKVPKAERPRYKAQLVNKLLEAISNILLSN